MEKRSEEHDMKDVPRLDRNDVQTVVEKNQQLKAYRPREDKVVCDIKCSVITVGEIDTVKQEFDADIFLSLRWREPKFDHRRHEDIDEGEFWDPRVYIPNAVTIDEKSRKYDVHFYPNVESYEAYAYLGLRIRGTFKTAMRLRNFPFDYQELTIKVASSCRKENVDFQRRLTGRGKILDNIYMDTFTGKHEWHLQEHIVCNGNGSADSNENRCHAREPAVLPTSDSSQSNTNRIKGNYPTYYIKLHAQRKPYYYIWNVVLPVFCILALSFTSFVIDADDPSERLGVTVTMLLTAVAFKSVVSSMLPKISYLTLLDNWLLCNFILQCLIVAQNAIVGVSWWNPSNRRLADFVSGIVLATLMLVANIGFVGRSRYAYVKSKQKLAKITQEYQDNKA